MCAQCRSTAKGKEEARTGQGKPDWTRGVGRENDCGVRMAMGCSEGKPSVCWPICEGSRKELVFPVIEERFGGLEWKHFSGSIYICLYVLLKKTLKSYKGVCTDDNDKI